MFFFLGIFALAGVYFWNKEDSSSVESTNKPTYDPYASTVLFPASKNATFDKIGDYSPNISRINPGTSPLFISFGKDAGYVSFTQDTPVKIAATLDATLSKTKVHQTVLSALFDVHAGDTLGLRSILARRKSTSSLRCGWKLSGGRL